MARSALLFSVAASPCAAAVISNLTEAPCDASFADVVSCDVRDAGVQSFIQGAAEEYCQRKGQDASSLDFFYGYLPQVAFQQLPHCSDEGSYPSQLGALWLSGYWGGIWLAGIVEPQKDAARQFIEGQLEAMVPDSAGLAARALLTAVSKIAAVANSSADDAVVKGCLPLLPGFTTVDAYNFGYLDAVRELRNISADDPEWLHCLDSPRHLCRVPDFAFDEQYFEAVEAHFNGTAKSGLRWMETKETLQNPTVEPFIAQGQRVWRFLGPHFHGEALVQLDLLGRKFLAIAEGATTGCAVGYAEEDAAAARCGLDSMAGMVAWAGAYALGLAASDPASIPQPALDCSSTMVV